MEVSDSLKERIHRSLRRDYIRSYFIWATNHRHLKRLLKDQPREVRRQFEDELDIAGTNAQIYLFRYELMQMNGFKTPKTQTQRHQTRKGDIRPQTAEWLPSSTKRYIQNIKFKKNFFKIKFYRG
jgi:hypothetical protein